MRTVLTRGSGPAEVEEMLYIRGNVDREYIFGGRLESQEQNDFAEAGLYPYAPLRSWNLTFEPGELPDFYLDEHEVTRRQYLQFLNAPDGYLAAANWTFRRTRPEGARQRALRDELSRESDSLDLPITGVDWDEATAYAYWVGKRLPSYVEWEYAVRGSSEYRLYSSHQAGQTDFPTPGEINYRSGPVGSAWPRGTFGKDIISEGVRNLSGNVAEWSATPVLFIREDSPLLQSPAPDHILHGRNHKLDLLTPAAENRFPKYYTLGASFSSDHFDFRKVDTAHRHLRLDEIGFRCAADGDTVRDSLDGKGPTWRRFEKVEP